MNHTPRYYIEEDAPFLPKDIFSADLYCAGLAPVITVKNITTVTTVKTLTAETTETTETTVATEETVAVKCVAGAGGAYVLQGEFGKCYEVKFTPEAKVVAAMQVSRDPRLLAENETIEGVKMDCDFDAQERFMYVCRSEQEFLVICVSEQGAPVSIGERTILQETDTAGDWFVPEPVGSLTDPDGTFGNYQWTAQQVMDNLYEPYRAKYPDYITRTHLGKDQTGQYDMYGYVYAPEHYKTTFFLTGGVHANEESAYYSLAKLMQLVSDATEDSLFYPLRQNVRFVVVPVVNVWGVSQDHDRAKAEERKRIRRNGENVDLNRDFGDATQQETKNVLAFFRQFADTVDFAMDFHNSNAESYPMWYNFINYAVNSQVNYKVTNHMYHRLMERGLCEKVPNIGKLPGKYFKSSMYLEGRIWNEFGVPTITVEHVTNSKFPDRNSDEGFTLGVETYGNFLIQNALFFIQR